MWWSNYSKLAGFTFCILARNQGLLALMNLLHVKPWIESKRLLQEQPYIKTIPFHLATWQIPSCRCLYRICSYYVPHRVTSLVLGMHELCWGFCMHVKDQHESTCLAVHSFFDNSGVWASLCALQLILGINSTTHLRESQLSQSSTCHVIIT